MSRYRVRRTVRSHRRDPIACRSTTEEYRFAADLADVLADHPELYAGAPSYIHGAQQELRVVAQRLIARHVLDRMPLLTTLGMAIAAARARRRRNYNRAVTKAMGAERAFYREDK